MKHLGEVDKRFTYVNRGEILHVTDEQISGIARALKTDPQPMSDGFSWVYRLSSGNLWIASLNPQVHGHRGNSVSYSPNDENRSFRLSQIRGLSVDEEAGSVDFTEDRAHETFTATLDSLGRVGLTTILKDRFA